MGVAVKRVKGWSSGAAAVVVALLVVVTSGWCTPAAAAYSTDAAPSWVPNGTVRAIARDGDVVYIGGDFTSLSKPGTTRQTRNRVAALDADSGELLPWNPSANGLVRAIAVADGRVYLGGDFTTVGGRTALRLAAVTPAGGDPVSGWSASASDSVHDLVADGGSLYVGGRFGSVNRTSRPKLARLDLDTGAVVSGFNARVGGGRVAALEVAPGGQLLLGGAFTAVGGQARGFVASVALDTGNLDAWNPGAECDTCYLWDLAVAPGHVYAAVGGPGGLAVAWDAADGDRLWARKGDGNAQAIDVQDGVVYVGGHFGPTFAAAERHQLAALDASRGGALLPYTVDFTGGDHPGIWAVEADADGLRIGGGFTLAGDPARKYALLPVL